MSSVEILFYNETIGAWFDLDLKTNGHVTQFYASGAAPLFAGCYDHLDKSKPGRFYQYLKVGLVLRVRVWGHYLAISDFWRLESSEWNSEQFLRN